MRIIVLTVAYCRSAQLARCLMELEGTDSFFDKHIIIQGHFPIDKERNKREIELIVESYCRGELWDPGDNIGSSQSQQWALDKLGLRDDDYVVNWDPDTACRTNKWIVDMQIALENDPDCVVISANSPMVETFKKERNQEFTEKVVGGVRIGILPTPTPFNLSMFRGSFIREIGGLKQAGLWWGELEGPIHHHASIRGKYHAYLLDHFENEEGKFFHPTTNATWKDLHCRTVGEHQFAGNYEDYLRYYHPQLIDLKL